MRGVKDVLILLSVSLNVAFVAAWSARSLSARSGGGEDRSGGVGPAGCPLYWDLGVTGDQWDRIGPRLGKFQDEVSEECLCISRATVELIDLVAAPEPGLPALAAKQKEILAAREGMQARFVDHLLEEKKVLTPDQQRRLFEKIRQGGCGCPGGRGCGDAVGGACCEKAARPGWRKSYESRGVAAPVHPGKEVGDEPGCGGCRRVRPDELTVTPAAAGEERVGTGGGCAPRCGCTADCRCLSGKDCPCTCARRPACPAGGRCLDAGWGGPDGRCPVEEGCSCEDGEPPCCGRTECGNGGRCRGVPCGRP